MRAELGPAADATVKAAHSQPVQNTHGERYSVLGRAQSSERLNNPHLVAAPEVQARQSGEPAERAHGAVRDGPAIRHIEALQVLRT